MAREPKLERLDIPAECRVVKDWFPARADAEAALSAIHIHIKTTGQTHTCACHTHTKPPRDAVPVYLDEFVIPERYRRAKRFCPCPCCLDEFGKFGRGRIAWFPEERVIRLIGEDCFASLNPEGHEQARDQREADIARRRYTDFLLANLGRLPEVIRVAERALVVAKAIEQFHTLLHNRLGTVRLNLWRHVRREGALPINVKEEEFRRGGGGEMYAHEVDATRTFATLPGYEMLDPATPRLSAAIERCLERIRRYDYGDNWQARADAMSDEERRIAAETLSRSVKTVTEKIAEIEKLRKFAERVTINTLRAWGEHKGCPVPFIYAHEGTHITFGRSDYQSVGVPLAKELQNHIGLIEFWTGLEPRRRQ